MKDYNKFAVLGFIMSLNVLPGLLAKKEDAVGQEVMNFDFTDPKEVERVFKMMSEKMKIIYKNTPQVKTMIVGNFLDMIERGVIKM